MYELCKSLFGSDVLMWTRVPVLCVSAQQSEQSEFSLWEYLLTTRPGIGWVKGAAAPTGVVLQLLICLMVFCSSTFVRRSGHFEVRAQDPMWIRVEEVLRSFNPTVLMQ